MNDLYLRTQTLVSTSLRAAGRYGLPLLAGAALLTGCGKKPEAAPPAPVEAAKPAEAAPAAEAPAEAAKPADPAAQANPAAEAPKEAAVPAEPAQPGAIAAPSDVAAPPADAVKTATGLASKVLQPATGTEKPSASDTVKVHYTGWTTDGKMFDSSVARGEPISFPLDRVIAGWTEGVQLMAKGEKRRLWIPENLAYQGRPGAPAGMLVFDVELLEIQKAPPAPEAPKDVAAPPADAEKTASGLASKVLQKGTGTTKPKAESVVQVHYSGWTTDGKMFDSSVTRGQPASFPLNRVVAGWTEGVQLMVEGEKRRFWIPESLAYQGRPGAPAGMLVFDVELLKIVQ